MRLVPGAPSQVCAGQNGATQDIDAINRAIGAKMKQAATTLGKAKVGVGQAVSGLL